MELEELSIQGPWRLPIKQVVILKTWESNTLYEVLCNFSHETYDIGIRRSYLVLSLGARRCSLRFYFLRTVTGYLRALGIDYFVLQVSHRYEVAPSSIVNGFWSPVWN